MTDEPPGDDRSYESTASSPDDTDDLARALSLPREDLVDLAGCRWWRVQHDTPVPDALVLQDGFADWYVAGEPLQVLLAVPTMAIGADLVVHLPQVTWHGQIPVLHPGHEVARGPIGPDLHRWLPDALAEAHRRRRSTFLWCRYCRTIQAPENIEGGVCHACLTEHQGVVF